MSEQGKIAWLGLIVFIVTGFGLLLAINLKQQLLVSFWSVIYVLVLPGWLLGRMLFSNTSLDVISQTILTLILSPILVAICSLISVLLGGRLSRDSILLISTLINWVFAGLLLLLSKKSEVIGASSGSSAFWTFFSPTLIVCALLIFAWFHIPVHNESFTELVFSVEKRSPKYAIVQGTISIISHENREYWYRLSCEDTDGKNLLIYQGYIFPDHRKDISIQTIELRKSMHKLSLSLTLDNNLDKKYRTIEIPGISCSSLVIKGTN